MKKFSIRGASWDSMFLTFGNVLTKLFSIISVKMMAEGLSLTEYGTYSQANLINTMGVSLIALGLVDALNYYFSGRQESINDELRSHIVNTVFFLEILAGVVFAVVVVLGQNLLVDYFENTALRLLLPIAAVLPMLSNLLYYYQVLCVGVGRAKLMSVYSLAMTAVRIITIYFSIYVLKSLLLIYIVLVLQDIVQIYAYHFVLKKKNVRINPLRISKVHIGSIFAYGIPMGIYLLTTTFSRELGKLVVGKLAGTESLAIYTNCSKLLPVDIIATSFAVVLVPHIICYVTEKNKEKSVTLFSNYLKVGYYSVWILGTMLLIAPQTMVSFLYDDKYLSGTTVFVLYIIDSMLRFASMHQIMVASNKANLLMLYSVGSLALNLALSVVLYYALGIVGPAVASLVSAVVYTALVLRKSIKLTDAKLSDILQWKEILWLLMTLAVLWVGCTLLCKGLEQWGVQSYLSMILSMAVFGCSALAIHFKKIFSILRIINTFRI